MIVYSTIGVILCVAAQLETFVDSKLRSLMLLFGLFVLSIALGLRDETGTDWIFYEDHYIRYANNLFDLGYNFDLGYQILVSIFVACGFSFNMFLFSYTSLCLGIFGFAFKKISRPNLALLLLYLNYLVAFMGTLRQLMALSIVVLAFILMHKSRAWGSLCALSAGLFHKSAFIILFFFNIILYITKISLSKIVFLFAFFLFSFLFADNIFELLLAIFSFSELITSKLIDYVVTDTSIPIFYVEDKFVVTLIFAKRFFIFLLLIILTRLERNNSLLSNATKIYAAGIFIFALLYSTLPAVAVRFGVYFTIFEIVGFASLSHVKFKQLFMLIIFLALSVYNFIALLVGVDSDLLVPYKGIFINQEVDRLLR